jgi:hypothetical protein
MNKVLYIKYKGNKRTTVMSDGTNTVLKLDTAPTVVVANTATVATTEYPTIMCASAISANHNAALDKYKKGYIDEYYNC